MKYKRTPFYVKYSLLQVLLCTRLNQGYNVATEKTTNFNTKQRANTVTFTRNISCMV